ncbi:hypothetical protein [Streptomyces profundus]|uniref:hypothetical protein n=1 Tax=Streptomyces profundus TaxID=2867410 RepID=UPI001D168B9C|nr:hypothetical protein [Streptomyces sp. MA3_2.13]UED83229.1 hypothetical protein K4G22_02630 [Streptomyces sp. MA3_2.13]
MRGRRRLAGLAAVGALVAGCSGSGGDEGSPGANGEKDAESRASAAPSPEAEQTPPDTQLSVPALYDTSRGWESTEEGTQFPLPRTGAVALYWERTSEVAPTEHGFTVLDATTGERRWSSVPIGPLGSTDLPHFRATVDGREYLVAWSTGVTGADAINRGEEITAIDIFPADSSGEAVEPLRVELPGEREVRNGGAGLLVRDGDDSVVAVDPATGDTTEYLVDDQEPPADCPDCHESWMVKGITENGPLMGTRTDIDYGGLWVPGGWATSDLRPPGTDPENDPSVGLVSDHLLVLGWGEEAASGETVWTAVDSASGETLATVNCAGDRSSETDVHLSANGRYLAHGNRVFDLEEGTGVCFQRTETTNAVEFRLASDPGVIYGYAIEPQGFTAAERPVQLDMRTGEIEQFDDIDIDLPFGDTAGYGLFWDGTLVAYPHAE